jgi:hypothetical protein
MPNSIPTMSLKQVALPQSNFTPQVYTPQTADMSLLANSLAQREARMEKAAAQEAAFNETASKLETLVNPNEKQWIYDYLNKQSQSFKNAIDAGDYGAAIRQATVAGSNLLKNPEAMGRIQAQEQFKKEQDRQQARVTSGDIKQSTYEWWMKNNPYKYEDIKDDNGNIIGGTEYISDNTPVKDIDFAAQAIAAFKLLTPYKNTNVRGSETSNAGYNDTENWSNSSSSKTSNSIERVTKEQILGVMDELVKSNPDGYRAVEQAFDVAQYDLQKLQDKYEKAYALDPNSNDTINLKEQLDERNRLMFNNGSPISYKEYYARMVTNELYAQGLAYNWKTTEKVTSSGNGKSARTVTTDSRTGNSSGGVSGGSDNGTWHIPGVYGKAPVTEQTENTNQAFDGVAQSGNNISSRLKK